MMLIVFMWLLRIMVLTYLLSTALYSQEPFWESTDLHGANIEVDAFTVAPDGTIYAGIYDRDTRSKKLYRSIDDGGHWEHVSGYDQGTEPDNITSIIVNDEGSILVSSYRGFYRSTDYGATWLQMTNGLVLDKDGTPIVAGILYVTATKSGDFMQAAANFPGISGTRSLISEDYGKSWEDPYDRLFAYIPLRDGLASVVEDQLGNVYVSDQGGCVSRLRMSGGKWQADSVGRTDSGVMLYADSGGVIYGYGYDSQYRSTDQGVTWVYRYNSTPGGWAIDRSGAIYSGSIDEAVLRSTDQGVTWESLAEGLDGYREVYYLCVTPSGRILAGLFTGGVYRSREHVSSVHNDLFLNRPSASLSVNPDPFSGSTLLHVQVPYVGAVNVDIYNQYGERVARMIDRVVGSGGVDIPFDPRGLPSGMYYAILNCAEGTITRRMIFRQ